MRYADHHKTETRARIVAVAANAIRRRGPERVAVAEVMAEAGLTHGGFYAHFPSKDALVAEAIDAMFADTQRRNPVLEDALADQQADMAAALRSYLSGYLSTAHRDRADRGCPLAALSGDIARGPDAARARFAQGIDRLTVRISSALERLDLPNPRREAGTLLAQLVGTMSLARALGRGERSDAMLADALAGLIARFGL